MWRNRLGAEIHGVPGLENQHVAGFQLEALLIGSAILDLVSKRGRKVSEVVEGLDV